METETNTQHRFDRPTEDVAEVCTCGATFAEGFNLQAVKVAHLKAHGVPVPGTDEPRTYVVGLPVVVTVDANGFVTVEVDTSELTAEVHDETANVSEASDEQVAADRDTLTAWVARHTVRAEGYAR